MPRILLTTFIIFFGISIHAGRESAGPPYWGFFAHKKINRIAIFSLPEPLFSFFRTESDYIEDHSIDPDKRRYAVKGEAECHFIDLDYYTDHPDSVGKILPIKWDDAVSKYGEDTLRKHGIAPWNTYFTYIKLKNAFEEKDHKKILRYAADMGHYIGDIHVPLHTTRNYNGQLTNQYGIHGFWESRLPEIFAENYRLFPSRATYYEKPAEAIWNAIIESHKALDSVLFFEKKLSETYLNKFSFEEKGSNTIKVYNRDFSLNYHEMLCGMVERRMLQSINFLGSMWYTAWINAGQPDLSTMRSEKLNSKAVSDDNVTDSLQYLRDHE